MLPPTAKPYLVRAIYDWCLAEGHTPYILAAESHAGVRVPEGYAKDGRITLNINPRAVQNLEVGADSIRFSARFGAAPFQVVVPYQAVVAIFASETHEGMVFGDPHETAAPSAKQQPGTAPLEAVPETETPAAASKAAETNPDADTPAAKSEPRLRLID